MCVSWEGLGTEVAEAGAGGGGHNGAMKSACGCVLCAFRDVNVWKESVLQRTCRLVGRQCANGDLGEKLNPCHNPGGIVNSNLWMLPLGRGSFE